MTLPDRMELLRELAAFAEQTGGRVVSPADLQLLEEWLDVYSAEEIRAALRGSVRYKPVKLFRYAARVLADNRRRKDDAYHRERDDDYDQGKCDAYDRRKDDMYHAGHRRNEPRRQDSRRQTDTDEEGRYLSGPFRGYTHEEVMIELYEN